MACGGPQKWSQLPEALAQLQKHWLQYLAPFVFWATLFGIAAASLGIKPTQFLPAFAAVFLISVLLYFTG